MLFRSPSSFTCSATCSVFSSSITPCPPSSALFPYTTLFRSLRSDDREHRRPGEEIGDQGPAFHRCPRSEEHTSELQSRGHLVCRLLLEKKNNRLPNYRFRLRSEKHSAGLQSATNLL